MNKTIQRMTVLAALFVLMVAPFSTSQCIAEDVTAHLNLVKSRLLFDRRTSISHQDVALGNIDFSPLLGPYRVIIESIDSPTVTVANPDGYTQDGKPFYQYENPQILPAGGISPGKTWKFNNPHRARFSYIHSVQAILPLYGTAAAGAPIIGTINVRGANGYTSLSPIGLDGSFVVNTSSLTPPFVVWAEGDVYGQQVILHSTIDRNDYVNVTPATNIIMAMALQQDPAAFYQANPGAGPPVQPDLDAARQTIVQLLSGLFSFLNLPPDFDLMNGKFTADSTGADSIFDALTFNSNAASNTVTVGDKGSGTIYYRKNVVTNAVTVQATPQQVQNISGNTVDLITRFNQIFDLIEQYGNQPQNIVDQYIRPLVADDFLDSARGKEQWLSDLVGDGTYGCDRCPNGRTHHLSIFRQMKTHTYGDLSPWTLDERAGHYDGYWVLGQSVCGGLSLPFVFSFVQTAAGGEWKLFGDRIPFKEEGNVVPVSVYSVNQWGLERYSGLGFNVNDVGNVALAAHGVEKTLVLNDHLPAFTSSAQNNTYNGLMMERMDGGLSTQYVLTSVPTYTPDIWEFFELDGLDINAISAPEEYLFVTMDALENPTHCWIDVLRQKPLHTADLRPELFASIILPDPSVLTTTTHINIGGDIDLAWQHPVENTMGFYPTTLGIKIKDNNTTESFKTKNHYQCSTTMAMTDWLSDTIDTSGTSVTLPATVFRTMVIYRNNGGYAMESKVWWHQN